ncbi:MAG: MBL fold metallo-hydrolase, partial [Akkermansiaceae bacterium]|nr:MBL fold metallo-hydrolase [Akkermansiaceae bacterium]
VRQLVEKHGAKACVSGLGGADWQSEWARENPAVRVLADGDSFHVGKIEIRAVHTPGHTPEHLSYLVIDHGGGAEEPALFLTGDFIFVGDVGRPDLLESAAGVAGAMEPSARTLYASLRKTAGLPGHLQVLPAHGAGRACGKALGAVPSSVLDYERLYNRPLREALEEDEQVFVDDILHGQPEPPRYFARMKRDNKLGPKVLEALPRPNRWTRSDLENSGDLDPWFLDLRHDKATFMRHHLRGSLHCPLQGVNVSMVAGSYIDDDEAVVLLVEDEGQVDEAVRQLVRIGLDRISGWMPAGEALEWAAEVGLMAKTERMKGAGLTPATGVILDVRTSVEHEAGAVPGAVNISSTRLRARHDEIPQGGPIYVHCGTGKRASFVVGYLERLGREVVWVDGPVPTGSACAV